VSFTLSQVGEHQVSVTFRGKHLQGSPFTLEVKDKPVYRREYSKVGDRPVSQFGSKGVSDGQFGWAWSVVCNLVGEIVVADTDNHRIQVFDRNGKFLFKFGSRGNGNGQFDRPCGATVDQRNNQIVVADAWNHRIQIFDEKWRAEESLGRWSFVEWDIVVSEDDGNKLQIFDSEGIFVRIVGAGRVKDPGHLIVDSDDNILVADYGNRRIQLFDQNGKHIKTIGTGQIHDPLSVCMDRDGRIIVCEGGDDAESISIF